VAGAKKNVGREKKNQKVYKVQVLGYREKKQLLATVGRTLHLKVTSWGGGKRSQLIGPHIVLPSVCGRVLRRRFFKNKF
jgi:hypothetical protein